METPRRTEASVDAALREALYKEVPKDQVLQTLKAPQPHASELLRVVSLFLNQLRLQKMDWRECNHEFDMSGFCENDAEVAFLKGVSKARAIPTLLGNCLNHMDIEFSLLNVLLFCACVQWLRNKKATKSSKQSARVFCRSMLRLTQEQVEAYFKN